jgi:thiol:disulfide interchange protein DsbD
MDRGWHTYWQNPGESGLPTTLAWNLPSGLSAGPILWPAPQALPVGPLMNYGFEGEVLLLTEVAVAPAAAGATSATLAARADWLVCKEICIPEGAARPRIAGRGDPTLPAMGQAIAAARYAPGAVPGWRRAARTKSGGDADCSRRRDRAVLSTSSRFRKDRSRLPASNRLCAIRAERSC